MCATFLLAKKKDNSSLYYDKPLEHFKRNPYYGTNVTTSVKYYIYEKIQFLKK